MNTFLGGFTHTSARSRAEILPSRPLPSVRMGSPPSSQSRNLRCFSFHHRSQYMWNPISNPVDSIFKMFLKSQLLLPPRCYLLTQTDIPCPWTESPNDLSSFRNPCTLAIYTPHSSHRVLVTVSHAGSPPGPQGLTPGAFFP